MVVICFVLHRAFPCLLVSRFFLKPIDLTMNFKSSTNTFAMTHIQFFPDRIMQKWLLDKKTLFVYS